MTRKNSLIFVANHTFFTALLFLFHLFSFLTLLYFSQKTRKKFNEIKFLKLNELLLKI